MKKNETLALLNYEMLSFQQQKQYQNDNIEEISNAIRLYLQAGIENSVLEELVRSESMIEERYRAMQKMVGTISIKTEDLENLQQKIFEWMNEAAYLQQLNAMLTLYHKQHRKLEERKNFQRYERKSKNLCGIVEVVSHSKMTIVQVEQNANINTRSVYNVLNQYADLFNESERDQQMFVSLSHKGQRFYDYLKAQEISDAEVWQETMYKNCRTIIKAVDDAIQSTAITPRKIDFVSFSLGQERALKQQYNSLSIKIGDIKKKNRTQYCATQVDELSGNNQRYMIVGGGNHEKIADSVYKRTGKAR